MRLTSRQRYLGHTALAHATAGRLSTPAPYGACRFRDGRLKPDSATAQPSGSQSFQARQICIGPSDRVCDSLCHQFLWW